MTNSALHLSYLATLTSDLKQETSYLTKGTLLNELCSQLRDLCTPNLQLQNILVIIKAGISAKRR